MRVRLINVSTALARIPSMGYALAYLALIPIFAFIYTLLPYHFYHSTIPYENAIRLDSDMIRGELTSALRDEFINHYGSPKAVFDGWQFHIDYLYVASLEPRPDGIAFNIRASATHSPPASISYMSFYIKAALTLDNQFIVQDTPATIVSSIDLEEAPMKPFSARYLFPYMPKSSPDTVVNTNLFVIPRALYSKLQDFVSASKGIPGHTSGGFWRMFYLSAVTITTLGFGDIVPITTKSRILISLEAIFGIVTIGLFLNALSHESRR